MRKTYILLVGLVLNGCGASMVSTRGDSASEYAPVNEKDGKVGVIKYLNDGSKGARKKRRESAYKQMSRYCGGPYRIVSEGQNSEGGSVIAPVAWGAFYSSSQYWYINFECQEAAH